MFVFELPEIGEGVVEGEIVRWLVSQGDVVGRDQPLAEVMTDKATVEISSPRAGRVVNLHGKPGDIIKVHTAFVDLDEAGGDAPSQAPAPSAPTPAAPVAAPVAAAAVAAVPVASAPVAPPASRSPGGKTLATPAVRSHARRAGVEIHDVPGSGKAGRVTHADIDAFAAEPDALVAPPAVALPALAPAGEDHRVRIIGLRRKIAEKMAESYRTVPHFTYVDEVDCTRLVALRGALKGRAEAAGVKLTYIPFIMKALAVVFREFPTINAVMDEGAFELVVRGDVNIGVATDTAAGLYVPVVKQVQRKSILELAVELADLSDRTRNNQVRLDELQGGTFTITSVGNIGGRFATPIINHPEVAILGVNQIHRRPVVIGDEIVARDMMYLSPSFDHRVIDGAVGARFVSALKAVLEQPEALLLELR